MDAKISVVIPVYNRQKYILDAIESVRKQTYPPLEIIVVDDDSTDGTACAVEAYSQTNDVHVRIVKNMRPKGVSGARNTGIESSLGDFIAFLDSDDMWLPGHLERLNDCLAKTGAMVVSADFKFFGVKELCEENERQFEKSKDVVLRKGFEQTGEGLYCSHQRLLETAFSDGIFFRVQASLVNKKVFRKHRIWFDERMDFLEDHQFFLECAYKRLPMSFVDEPAVAVRKYRSDSHYDADASREYQIDKIVRILDRRIMSIAELEEFNRMLYWMSYSILKTNSVGKNAVLRAIESGKFLRRCPTNRGLREAVKNIIPLKLSVFLFQCWKRSRIGL